MKNLSSPGNVKIINPGKLAAEGITGEIVSGVFEGLRVEERQQKSTGKKFTSREFIFKDENGDQVIVNSTGHLAYLMEAQDVQPGDKLKVLYFGKDNQDRHQFKLLAA